jgi:SSS family solute:Na+ symporter
MAANMLAIGLLLYFGILFTISKVLSKSNSNTAFFTANKNAPWYLVAFGMIGATLSGVTFISVPGWVQTTQLSYVQMVLGYGVGYFFIATVLLPLYYKWKLVSIYEYLAERFGTVTHKTGASFFVLSRIVGTGFRLFLVLKVFHWIALDAWQIPFWLSAAIALFGIWLYTQKTGIKTIIYTDTIQTICMLISLGLGIYILGNTLEVEASSIWTWWQEQENTQVFFWNDLNSGQHFLKQFFAGALIAFAMTGLDQEMMQKNLSCRTLHDAQKNMFWFTLALIFVTCLFLVLGVLLTAYAAANGISTSGDNLFALIATQSGLGNVLAYAFVMGLIAAAFSSADSSLTSLTTSVSVDLWRIDKGAKGIRQRKKIHIGTALVLWLCIVSFYYLIKDESVIKQLLLFAGYTYGPLLGLFLFGIFTNRNVKDNWVPVLCVISPVLSYLIATYVKNKYGFDFGFFVLALNGLLMIVMLFLSGIGLPMYQRTSPSKATSKSGK